MPRPKREFYERVDEDFDDPSYETVPMCEECGTRHGFDEYCPVERML